MRDEYDFSHGTRNKYAGRLRRRSNHRLYARDVAAVAEAYVAWQAAHHEAWARHDYALYVHSVAAVVMLPDGITIDIRVR